MKKIEAWKKENTVSTRRLSANEFEKYDLSDFWKEPYILGYIGSNFQRLYITFEKIKRISTTEYQVTGFSQVKSNICQFRGVIHNITFNQYLSSEANYGNVNENFCDLYDDHEVLARGNLMADFRLEEEPGQKGSGVFVGMLESQWVKLTNEKLFRTNKGCMGGETGSQFFGEWISYKGSRKFVAWGIYRIPFSDKLDIGASEFSPVDEYINNGWEEFKNLYENILINIL
jgi:hypothetical protein